ncbi:SAM-dependent methyltransferase [Bailinhaonella thermotolerans]|uniref:SAM-dependent methyltransferase n=1 Tax=Bailinhaonella thermotolerans TaxID=1070861 RepID=A0A3A4B2V0_9ACTN|nr:SAM-dependent methyltransferase [Bailinhaonella thermotolerans]RJL31720.1 SAM-dependent methyltransferase [Bailinhaonella thermotolerans]
MTRFPRWSEIPQAAPTAEIDPDVPSPARMYDYFLGGKDNFAADRAAGDRVIAAAPEVLAAVKDNRAFLRRAVTHLAGDLGIRYFLDLGAGLPTQGNVHEIARAAQPDSHVVYVDNDPIVLSHGRALLAGDAHTRVIQGDVRDPAAILADPSVAAMFELGEPVAVLFVAVLHFVSDEEDPMGVLDTFRAAMPPGSHLVITHASPGGNPGGAAAAAEAWRRSTANMHLRSPAEIAAFFKGFELLDPGLVPAQRWRADAPPPTGQGVFLAGVGALT